MMLLVSGIGHKIKSVNNPDLRVELVKEYVRKHFPSHSLLDYALAVEKVTTAKKDTVRRFPHFCINPITHAPPAYLKCRWLYCCLLRRPFT